MIFACKASGYPSDRYISYCGATEYGDYEHGAFWFDLEPVAELSAANADVIFLGNSRTQFGFSTPGNGAMVFVSLGQLLSARLRSLGKLDI
jgi:hypothetical protein